MSSPQTANTIASLSPRVPACRRWYTSLSCGRAPCLSVQCPSVRPCAAGGCCSTFGLLPFPVTLSRGHLLWQVLEEPTPWWPGSGITHVWRLPVPRVPQIPQIQPFGLCRPAVNPLVLSASPSHRTPPCCPIGGLVSGARYPPLPGLAWDPCYGREHLAVILGHLLTQER